MAFGKREVRDLYRKRAQWYDLSANLYYLLGFREFAYRRRAVRALRLGPGDAVVEVGCGTGLNFQLLREAVGPEGHIIGVDMTDRMLDRARDRVERHGWSNVELVESDAASYRFPADIDGILSTFALTLVPEYDEVIRRGAEALAPERRWVVLDLKIPTGWSAKLLPLLLPLFRPFGVTRDLGARHPWKSLERHLGNVDVTESYLGYVYLATAQKTAS